MTPSNHKKGFTLIELLVVISIIGLLSSVVLASLRSARDRGNNAAVKSNMNNLRTQAAMYYDQYNNYAVVCSDPLIIRGRDAASMAGANNTTSDICNGSSGAWAASVPLKTAEGSNNYWCVDWAGTSKGHPSALGSATTCP